MDRNSFRSSSPFARVLRPADQQRDKSRSTNSLFGAGLRPRRDGPTVGLPTGAMTRRPSVTPVARSGDLATTWSRRGCAKALWEDFRTPRQNPRSRMSGWWGLPCGPNLDPQDGTEPGFARRAAIEPMNEGELLTRVCVGSVALFRNLAVLLISMASALSRFAPRWTTLFRSRFPSPRPRLGPFVDPRSKPSGTKPFLGDAYDGRFGFVRHPAAFPRSYTLLAALECGTAALGRLTSQREGELAPSHTFTLTGSHLAHQRPVASSVLPNCRPRSREL